MSGRFWNLGKMAKWGMRMRMSSPSIIWHHWLSEYAKPIVEFSFCHSFDLGKSRCCATASNVQLACRMLSAWITPVQLRCASVAKELSPTEIDSFPPSFFSREAFLAGGADSWHLVDLGLRAPASKCSAGGVEVRGLQRAMPVGWLTGKMAA
jgi:hypothetical protein